MGLHFATYMHRRLNYTDNRGHILNPDALPVFLKKAIQAVVDTVGFHPQEIDMFERTLLRAYRGRYEAPFEVVNLSRNKD